MDQEPYAKLLAELLTHAKTNGCGCGVCVSLRAAWTVLDVDRAVGVPRPAAICEECWASPAAVVQQLHVGAVTIGAAAPGRCVLCGFGNDESPRRVAGA